EAVGQFQKTGGPKGTQLRPLFPLLVTTALLSARSVDPHLPLPQRTTVVHTGWKRGRKRARLAAPHTGADGGRWESRGHRVARAEVGYQTGLTVRVPIIKRM